MYLSLQWGYLRRLKQLRQVLEASDFFRAHEVRCGTVLLNSAVDVLNRIWKCKGKNHRACSKIAILEMYGAHFFVGWCRQA